MDAESRWIDDSDLTRAAFELAAWAHGVGALDDTTIDHPVAVAQLLHNADFPEVVVVAALLHDVVEDTTVDLVVIEKRFGAEVAGLVSEMTEDEAIESYEDRKAEHRERMSHSSRVAAIYAADKLATMRYLDDASQVAPEQLSHYAETLHVLASSNPDLPFLDELVAELERLLRAG